MATAIYKQGSRGEVVKQIQKALNLYPDGIYGRLTAERVKEWQQTHGLTADGIVGPVTLAKLLPTVAATTLKLKKSVRNITELIIHCTATPEGKDYTVADIKRWHTLPVSKGGRGWSDIGYHYIIYRDGSVHEGRNVNVSGAHCTGHNSHSIGIVYVGGMDAQNKQPKDTRTEAQKTALLCLLLDLRKLYPKASIRGHRDFAAKDCPSFDATKEYRMI